MNIEDILIQALDEPRSYTQWYQEATKLRKEKQQRLSKTTFNEAKKRLENEDLIFSKEINGREKQFSINEDKDLIIFYKTILKTENSINAYLTGAMNLLEIVKLLNEYHPRSKKLFANDKGLYESLVYQIHEIILIQGSLALQSNFFEKSDLTRSKIEELMRTSNLTLEYFFMFSRQLSPNLFYRVYLAVNNRISNEINKEKSPPSINITSKYFKKLKRQSHVKNAKPV